MTAINDPLLMQLQYVDEAYNLKFWIDEFHHYHERAEQTKKFTSQGKDRFHVRANALARMCAVCADRSLTNMVYYREQLEEQAPRSPLSPTPQLIELRAKALFFGVEAVRTHFTDYAEDPKPWCLEKINEGGRFITARGKTWFMTEYQALRTYLEEQRINGYPDRLDT